MVDIDGQIDYWRRGSQEDWDVAVKLVKDGSSRHGLFFAHLALEKAIKAIVCRRTHDIPPRIHNLTRLCDLASLEPDEHQREVLAEMNQFNLEGRYPEFLTLSPRSDEADAYVARAQEVLAWLTRQS